MKVFSDKGGKTEFYRDGYTDMTGTFRYVLADTNEITLFRVLVSTQRGGVVHKIKPPTKAASY